MQKWCLQNSFNVYNLRTWSSPILIADRWQRCGCRTAIWLNYCYSLFVPLGLETGLSTCNAFTTWYHGCLHTTEQTTVGISLSTGTTWSLAETHPDAHALLEAGEFAVQRSHNVFAQVPGFSETAPRAVTRKNENFLGKCPLSIAARALNRKLWTSAQWTGVP